MAETLNKAIKAIKAYAKANGKNFIQVKLEWTHEYNNMDKGELKFSAYIDGFGIYPNSDTIAGLIEQFETVKSGVKPPPKATGDDLPF